MDSPVLDFKPLLFHFCSNPCSASRQLCEPGALLNHAASALLICEMGMIIIIVPTWSEASGDNVCWQSILIQGRRY